MQALVSIIIPLYNREDLILETLDSVKAQTYTNWECIIVDDGSTDNSFKVVEDYIENDIRFKLFIRPENRLKGANACRNYGFDVSNGNYILFLDSDDILDEFKLEYTLNHFNNDSSIKVVVSNGYCFSKDPKLKVKQWRPNIYSENLISDLIKENIGWQTSFPIWKKDLLNGINLFNESLQAAQEYEFHVRMFIEKNIEKESLYILDEELVYIRIDNPSITRVGGYISMRYFYSRYLLLCQNNLNDIDYNYLFRYLIKLVLISRDIKSRFYAFFKLIFKPKKLIHIRMLLLMLIGRGWRELIKNG